MAQTPQPHFLSSWVAAFATFDAAHGWAVNLFAVVALAAIGLAFLSARPRLVRAGVIAGLVLCLGDWVLIEDLGFMGGVGTDPNSMIPIALVFVAGYLALSRVSVAENIVPSLPTPSASCGSWWERATAKPTYTFRAIAALGAMGITLVGAVPMALAATNPNADPILAQAVNGSPTPSNTPAPNFQLIDQHGRPVSLASLHGKTLAVTFLDDVCTTDCPLIVEFRLADRMLGASARRVDLVAINANPRFITPDYLRAFDQQEGLTDLRNWLYLTGSSLAQLEETWRGFGADIQYLPGGSMIDHSEFADVIDPSGHIRYLLNTDPGPATEATKSSFSVSLAETINRVVASS